MKLQDAFVAEVGASYGNFAKIGYEMADGAVFNYENPGSYSTDGTASLNSTAAQVWTATTLTALNNCKLGAVWSLKIALNSTTGGTASYTAILNENGSTAGVCKALTPNFQNLSSDHQWGSAS